MIGSGELSDEQLMVGCRDAPEDQARQLVGELARRHLDRVTQFVYGLTGDPTGALDLAQEAFVRVYRHRARYKEVARFSTWLYTIARNLALNELRDRKRRPRTAGGGAGTDSDERAGLGQAPTDGPTPAEAAATSDLQALVRREVAALPDAYRAVVVLCDLQERPYAEAAEILDVPVGTVRSRLFRARARLEERLRRALPEGSR